jgi:hypothetical protein
MLNMLIAVSTSPKYQRIVTNFQRIVMSRQFNTLRIRYTFCYPASSCAVISSQNDNIGHPVLNTSEAHVRAWYRHRPCISPTSHIIPCGLNRIRKFNGRPKLDLIPGPIKMHTQAEWFLAPACLAMSNRRILASTLA